MNSCERPKIVKEVLNRLVRYSITEGADSMKGLLGLLFIFLGVFIGVITVDDVFIENLIIKLCAIFFIIIGSKLMKIKKYKLPLR